MTPHGRDPFGFLAGLATGAAARARSLWRGLTGRDDVEAEMREEFRHHIELRTEALIREGLSPREAERKARLEFGHTETHRDAARASRGLAIFDQIRFSWLDVKLGLRMLWKHPGLTVVAVFSLAVGIPVGLTPTHLARAIEAPLPVDGGERIRAIRLRSAETASTVSPSYFEFARWRGELTSFQALGAVRNEWMNVTPDGGAPGSTLAAVTTSSTFPVLRAAPLLGRTLIPDDERVGAPDVAVIGFDLWQSRLGGDPDVVGSTLRIGDTPHTVVGVMPDGFLFPVSQQLWLPLREEAETEPGGGLGLWVFGRLADGVTPDDAHAEVTASGQRMASDFPESHARLEPEVVPFGLVMTGIPRGGLDAMPEFYFFQALALLLLVVPCANVAMLIFARTSTRSRELAVRTALGASRTRIVSQVLTESMVLALVAAGVGLLSVDRGLSLLIAYGENDLGATIPYWLDLGVTPTAVVRALGLAVLCAVVAGVIPALRVTGEKIQAIIKRSRAARGGTRFGGVTSALVIADVAIAVVVIGFAAGLSGRLLDAVGGEDLIGIPAEEYLAVSLSLPTGEATTVGAGFDLPQFSQRLAGIQRELTERLVAEPGIRSVAVASALPRMEHRSARVEVERADGADGSTVRYVRSARVDVDYFATLNRPILAGRGFDGSDLTADRSTVVVNQTFVDLLLGGRNPIGRRIRFVPTGADPDAPWLEIVGVVGHLGANILDPGVAVYIPAAPGEIHPLRFAVHAGDDPEALVPRVREIVADVDPTAVLAPPTALDRAYQGDWYLMVAATGGMALFVGILITLAASGVYAILSFAVSERTREVGIRTALGARRRTIAFLLARRVLVLLGVGALLGTPLAGRVLLFAIRDDGGAALSTGSAAFGAVLMGLAVAGLIALFACTAPVVRALRIEPTEALREEG